MGRNKAAKLIVVNISAVGRLLWLGGRKVAFWAAEIKQRENPAAQPQWNKLLLADAGEPGDRALVSLITQGGLVEIGDDLVVKVQGKQASRK